LGVTTFSDSHALSGLMTTAAFCRNDPAISAAPMDRSALSAWRGYAHWLLPLALLPLAFSLGQPDDDILNRFRQTLLETTTDIRLRVELIEQNPNASLDDLLAALPGQRIQGSLFSRPTHLHWLFAIAAAVIFLGLTSRVFRTYTTSISQLIGMCLFAGTIGIAVLLTIEGIVSPTWHEVLDSETNFPLSVCGYIIGVGLVEELAKALPLLWLIKLRGPVNWRTACLWGLTSGIGFGIAEGVFYAERIYNGLASADAYLVRFVSCVALHAIWSGSVGLGIIKAGSAIREPNDAPVYFVALMRVLAIPVILHGLYDVLLQYQFHAAGLVVALASFGWLAWLIESERQHDELRDSWLDAQFAGERA